MKIIYSFLLFSIIIADVKSQEIIKIGKQVWMKENLSVSKFRNGDIIPEAKTEKEWIKGNIEKKPMWCYYENSDSNGKIYGKLYNIYAVLDSRGLSPKGFHIPDEKEWNMLIELSGGIENAGSKLKNPNGWCNNGNGVPNSVFRGKLGGFRSENGEFVNITCGAYWWTKEGEVIFLNWSENAVKTNNGLSCGYSIRCLKN